jgi:hypothetical protein
MVMPADFLNQPGVAFFGFGLCHGGNVYRSSRERTVFYELTLGVPPSMPM